MAKKSLSANPLKVNNSVENYTRNGRQIASGHDFGTASYWYRLDGGTLREFSTRQQMEKALDVELTPIVRIPDLPQLPANVPTRIASEVKHAHHRRWVAFRMDYKPCFVTRGAIVLPASTTPEPPKKAPVTREQKALQYYRSEFLKAVDDYFKAWCDLDSGKLTSYDARGRKWDMDCAFMTLGNKAFTYAQLVGQGAS